MKFRLNGLEAMVLTFYITEFTQLAFVSNFVHLVRNRRIVSNYVVSIYLCIGSFSISSTFLRSTPSNSALYK